MPTRIVIGDRVIWEAFPIQEKPIAATENEILFGGARGGTKSETGRFWMIKGNTEPTGTKADAGYIYHPGYRGLVLRRNITDMGDWIAKAKVLYSQLGGTYTARPSEFTFPSGAVIVVGHLEDENAFEKYQGQEFARILIEELTQIPSEDLYKKVLASNRSPYDELKRQVFLTANPGGPGHSWVRERFLVPAPPGVPYLDPKTGRSRIYIPARVQDNPIYAQDREYIGILMDLSPAMRRAWLEGDWDAIAGQYFDEFRLQPNTSLNEPASARHVWHSWEAKLQPWYNRWLSCDWGYSHNAAVYKYCQEPNQRIHVTDELVVNHTTPEELGLLIGQFIWPDLQQKSAQQRYQLFLSPDAFGTRTEERTIADQIATGIERVLGPDSVYILPPGPGSTVSDIFSRASLQQTAAIAIQRAPNQRVPGWMYMKSLMRWWPSAPANDDRFDPALALSLHHSSPAKHAEYMSMFARPEEVLPKLVIHGDRCPKLCAAIPLARATDPDKGDPEDVDKKHMKDVSDQIDSLRYGLFGSKFLQIQAPFEQYYSEHMERYAAGRPLDTLDGNTKVWMARKAEADYERLSGANAKPIHFPVSSARAHRLRERDIASDFLRAPERT